ncbi:MAG: DMT family transporter [Cellvibrionaceae bacterium]
MGKMSTGLIIAALLAVLSMSLVPLLIRTTSANEFTIGIVRIFIALLFLSPVVFFKNGKPSLGVSDWKNLALVGVVFGSHWLTYFISIKTANASIAALSLSTYGIHLLLLSWMFRKQQIRAVEWFAVAMCFGGCVLIAPSLNLKDKMTLGMLIGVFSGFLYACLPLLHQRILHVPTMTRAWGQFLFSGIIFFPFITKTDWNLEFDDWWRLAVLGVVCTVIGHSLWVKVSSELPAVITGVVYYLYVPIAMISSFYLLKEVITPVMIIGAILIVGANILIALMTWRRTRGLR